MLGADSDSIQPEIGMTTANNFNQRIIEEFRANGGKVGGPFEGAPMLLLTSTGAKSGRRHTTPLVYLPDGDRFVVIASKGGAPKHPDWYHNLVAHPETTIEVGSETIPVTAVVITGEERDRLYATQAGLRPAFSEYQTKTTRRIPVVALERREG
jgi:deazaflavin-dependent oxidoreductase (nitroreductase family)